MNSLKNIFKHPFTVALPSFIALFIWFYSQYSMFGVYEKYYQATPNYIFMIIGLLGFLFWFFACFKNVGKRFLFSKNSLYPFCYSLFPILFVFISSGVAREVSNFPEANNFENMIMISGLILFFVDVALEIKARLKLGQHKQ